MYRVFVPVGQANQKQHAVSDWWFTRSESVSLQLWNTRYSVQYIPTHVPHVVFQVQVVMFILLCAPLHIWLKHWRKQVRRCFTPCRSFIIKTLTTVGRRRFEKIMPWSKQWVMSNRRYRLWHKVSGCPVCLPSREVQARFDTWWDVVPQSYRGTLLSFLSRVGVDQWQMGMGRWLHFF